MLVDEHLQVTTSVIIINSWVVITAVLLSTLLQNSFETSAVCQSEAAMKCSWDSLGDTFVSVITRACLLSNLCELEVYTFPEA